MRLSPFFNDWAVSYLRARRYDKDTKAALPFCIDVKLDGERIICHKTGTNLLLHTRRSTDYTNLYGPVLMEYVLTARVSPSPGHSRPPPHCRSIMKHITVENVVLDGEIIAWNTETNKAMPFGGNRNVAAEMVAKMEAGEDASKLPQYMRYVVFDLLYVAGDGVAKIINDVTEGRFRHAGSLHSLSASDRRACT